MKRSHVIGLVVIAVGIAVLVSVSADFSTYSTFGKAAAAPERSHRLIGSLLKDKEIVYEPSIDPNYFSFYIRDEAGEERKVIYKGPKPQDFERSEQIVFLGKVKGDEFEAQSLQLKCPSKYEDDETKFTTKRSSM